MTRDGLESSKRRTLSSQHATSSRALLGPLNEVVVASLSLISRGRVYVIGMRRSQRPRKLCLAWSSVVVAVALPACAFWELDDWSAHVADAGVADGGSGPDTSAPPPFCASVGAASLFCDDFDTDGAVWNSTQTCLTCSYGTGVPDGEAAPSPPNVLFVDAPAGEANPSAYRQKSLVGDYPSITGEFWGYVERADANGQAAFQELAYVVDAGDSIRVRIFVERSSIYLGTAVNATSLSGVTYTDVASAAFEQRMWHHVSYTLATSGTTRTISWTVDGVVKVSALPIQDADHVVGRATRVDLRSGIFYIGDHATDGGTRVRMDNVRLVAP